MSAQEEDSAYAGGEQSVHRRRIMHAQEEINA